MTDFKSLAKRIVKPLVPVSARAFLRRMQNQLSMYRAMQEKKKKPPQTLSWGVTLIGDLNGGSGLAEASRGNLRCMEMAGIPVNAFRMEANELRRVNSDKGILFVHTNPDQMFRICQNLPSEQWRGRYVIGEWAWEQETIPKSWIECLPLFDEIWTPSEFTARAIRKTTELPVQVVPHIVHPRCDDNYNRNSFGLPNDLFLCLIVFDYNSVMERKNPEGAIHAYKLAFRLCKEQVGLVIKARNLTAQAKHWIESRLQGWPNIFIINQDFSHEQVNSLIRSVDVYISLHRAEGFGLVMAEAMRLGTPVVATNWSGNTEFMNADVACMVDVEMKSLEKDYPPFLKGSRWADPDIDQAAMFLQKLYEQPEWRSQLSAVAQESIVSELSEERISKLISTRLCEIKKQRFERMGWQK